MLDPLTALGVASNILSFIDFGVKLASGAIGIYGSIEGASKDNMALEAITRDLSEMSDDLGQNARMLKRMRVGTNRVSQATMSQVPPLLQLASHCNQLADNLINTLEKLKVKGSFKAMKSGAATLKTLLKADEIAALQRSLNDARSQMTIRITILISEQQRDMFEYLRTESENRDRSERTIKISTEKLEQGMASIASQLSVAPDKADLELISLQMEALSEEWKHTSIVLKVINSLSFDSIHERWVSVHEAHETTFQWALKLKDDRQRTLPSDVPSLGDWLRKGNEFFWITGKPGSGKSTFMKYLFANPTTSDFLQEWSGQGEAFKAIHLFWAAGTAMQRSLVGLLQSLLNDLLRNAPQLTEVLISKDRLEAGIHSTSPWTTKELRQCFSRLKTQKELDLKICFFVDGLDEYEGDHEEALELFKDLAQHKGIKFCVAGRDWNVFRDFFVGHETLRLENLTQNDIRDFTQSKLQEDKRFAALRLEDTTYDNLIVLIVHEAQGVFLWVFLVVQSLKRGFIEGDTVHDLMRRTKSLPKKLDDFFLLILNAVEEVYHAQSAELLQICQADSDGQLSLALASYFDEDDDLFGTKCQVKHRWTSEQLIRRCESTERRIRARCRDLIIVDEKKYQATEERHLQFVHRTAKDFVQSEHVQRVLRSRVRKGFDAERYLCQANIALAKMMPRTKRKWGALNEFEEYGVGALRHADIYETCNESSCSLSMSWLDELNATLEGEGFIGPDANKRVIVQDGLHNSWLFNQAVRHSNLRYLKHCIDPFSETAGWNTVLGPKLIKNLVQGSMRKNSLSLLQTAFFLLSLGSIAGETVVIDCMKERLCVLCLESLSGSSWWVMKEDFSELVRQFVDEILRRTIIKTLEPTSYKALKRHAIELASWDEVSSAGLASFLSPADRMEAEMKAAARLTTAVRESWYAVTANNPFSRRRRRSRETDDTGGNI